MLAVNNLVKNLNGVLAINDISAKFPKGKATVILGGSGSGKTTSMLAVSNLVKNFNGVPAINDISAKFPKGKVTVILGGSGSGKTTLIRLLTGLTEPSFGEILFDGENILKLNTADMTKLRADMGMVFQYSALINTLNVEDNIMFPLNEHTNLTMDEKIKTVNKLLDDVQLSGINKKMPDELSGGMAKRVALARAIALKPKVIFYDEPTSGLDPIAAKTITNLIKDLNYKFNNTAILITHNVEEALFLADHIILLWEGKIIFDGDTQKIKKSTDKRIVNFINSPYLTKGNSV